MNNGVRHINLSIAYYSLDNSTERYVFYFYENSEIIDKNIEYIVNSDFSSFSVKYKEIIKKNNFEIDNVDLFIIDKHTKINFIKFPLRKFNILKENFVINSLKTKYGNDYRKKYKVFNESLKFNNELSVSRQILVENDVISNAEHALSFLGIKKYLVHSMPYCLENFLSSQNVDNRLVVYFEASYIYIGSFVSGHLLDFVFLEDNDHIKLGLGNSIDLQLNNVEKTIKSLVWKYEKENIVFSKIDVFCNSQRKLDKFIRKQNILNFPTNVFESTDILFRPSNNKPKNIKTGFTLVETVVSFTVFAIAFAITASMIAFSNSQNATSRLNSKLNSYLYSVSEAFYAEPSVNSIKKITAINDFVPGDDIHEYFINSNLDFLKPSLVNENMAYKVTWKYVENKKEEDVIQPYTVHNFSILGIYKNGDSKNLINPKNIKVVK